jgi:hypothetical protein
LTEIQVPILERADADAPQRAYWVSYRFAHPAHLPIPALANRQS